jgi:hypothetical protein
MSRFFALPALSAICVLIVLLVPTAALAEGNADRLEFNHDIRIQPEEQVGDVTCINCSVYVLGRVSGDVTTVNGNIVAEQGAAIAGDVTTVRGNVRVENGAQVAGDLTAIAGTARRDPQATVGGDVTSLGGGGWVFLVFLLPFAILGAIIALIIWLIQRSRRAAPLPAYTLRGN